MAGTSSLSAALIEPSTPQAVAVVHYCSREVVMKMSGEMDSGQGSPRPAFTAGEGVLGAQSKRRQSPDRWVESQQGQWCQCMIGQQLPVAVPPIPSRCPFLSPSSARRPEGKMREARAARRCRREADHRTRSSSRGRPSGMEVRRRRRRREAASRRSRLDGPGFDGTTTTTSSLLPSSGSHT